MQPPCLGRGLKREQLVNACPLVASRLGCVSGVWGYCDLAFGDGPTAVLLRNSCYCCAASGQTMRKTEMAQIIQTMSKPEIGQINQARDILKTENPLIAPYKTSTDIKSLLQSNEELIVLSETLSW